MSDAALRGIVADLIAPGEFSLRSIQRNLRSRCGPLQLLVPQFRPWWFELISALMRHPSLSGMITRARVGADLSCLSIDGQFSAMMGVRGQQHWGAKGRDGKAAAKKGEIRALLSVVSPSGLLDAYPARRSMWPQDRDYK